MSYGYGRSCMLCGGTETGESHRGYVGRCTCAVPSGVGPANSWDNSTARRNATNQVDVKTSDEDKT